MPDKDKRVARWYFGGLASAAAACCTHPLDLLKVQLQTHQDGKVSVVGLTKDIIQKNGFLALYNGLSASLCRQLTYSTTRFGIYEVAKQKLNSDSFAAKVGIAAGAGLCGGFVGTPADLVNVRMQNDMKLPKEKRRNYKHAIDGLWRVYKEEGIRRLWGGATTASSRAVLMTVGQLSFYDQIKVYLLRTSFFKDNLFTHLFCSSLAGAIATSLTQPLDVLKTRAMNARPGEFKNLWAIIVYTAKLGPLGFFKGYVPAFVRLAPQTIFTFVFLEQLRLNFGILKLENIEGCIATCLTQPADVLKTRMMNAAPGEFNGVMDCIRYTAKGGPLAFYRGFVPSMLRILPITVMLFVFYEQLRMNFGYIKEPAEEARSKF